MFSAAQMEWSFHSKRAKSCVITWRLIIPTQGVYNDIQKDCWSEDKHTEKKKQGVLGYLEQVEMN